MENSRQFHGAGLFALLAAATSLVPSAGAQATQRVSGPYEHHNLAVYLVHADGTKGGVTGEVVTLDAALAAGHVVLRETGDVNQLSIQNTSRSQSVFVQAGDIVKGGKQDRVLSQDLILGPRSGQVSIDAFCVESGRWNARDGEEVASFGSSKKALSSKELKMAARSAKSQEDVWREVEVLQGRLSDALKTPVAKPQVRDQPAAQPRERSACRDEEGLSWRSFRRSPRTTATPLASPSPSTARSRRPRCTLSPICSVHCGRSSLTPPLPRRSPACNPRAHRHRQSPR